jgi:hypothetical protein
MRSSLVSTLIVAALVAAGCDTDKALVGEPSPNATPETDVTGTAPSPAQSRYEVSFFWFGSDPDGEITGFEWRISDNGRDGMVSVADTLVSNLPWRFTERGDSTFLVSADLDSFEVDVDDPNLGPGDYRFWQTHTFWVRAVDDDGARDPSPAHISFTATTLAPSALITTPRRTNSVTCRPAPQVTTFGWRARDEDSSPPVPEAVRYLFLPVQTGDDDLCLTALAYEMQQPIRTDDPTWSEWIPYDDGSDSSRVVTLPRQPLGTRWLFAVQARDRAGATTPTFDWNENVVHVEIQSGTYPLLRVRETTLGEKQAVSTTGLASYEIVSGQPLQFQWIADASHYSGIIDGYRYGWNVRDPEDAEDPGWEIPWSDGSLARSAPLRTFTQGSPNFVVQCRDNSGTISRMIYQFQVIQITDRSEQRSLLVIDDWPIGGTTPEQVLKLEWRRRWEELLMGRVIGFQPWEIVDAQTDAAVVTFSRINEYKAVIWFLNPASTSYFASRLAPKDLQDRFNWLEAYQARSGNLLVCGPGATFGTFDRTPFNVPWRFPVIFTSAEWPDLGFGRRSRPDGTVFNIGTTRWPYSAWCLESMDQVRPAAVGSVFGERRGERVRSLRCDGLARAEVIPSFLQEFPDASGLVRDLQPRTERTELDPRYKLQAEEFYNRNLTSRPLILYPRPCQIPMYALRSLRDEGYVDDPQHTCEPEGLERSGLDGVPIAIASSVYSDSKQLRGAEDFLWGFHPLAFQSAEVGNALSWILESRWQIPVRR